MGLTRARRIDIWKMRDTTQQSQAQAVGSKTAVTSVDWTERLVNTSRMASEVETPESFTTPAGVNCTRPPLLVIPITLTPRPTTAAAAGKAAAIIQYAINRFGFEGWVGKREVQNFRGLKPANAVRTNALRPRSG